MDTSARHRPATSDAGNSEGSSAIGGAKTSHVPRGRWNAWILGAAFLGVVWRWLQTTDRTAAELEQEDGHIALPGAQAVDHAGFVVPDLDQAITFFREVLGAAVLWQAGPVSGRKLNLRARFNADPRAIARMAMLRLGPNLNVELTEFAVPDETRTAPLSSAVGVGHLAFTVTDVDAAATYLSARGVRLLQGPNTSRVGPNAGEVSWYFMTPWGMALELVHRPPLHPCELTGNARLYRHGAQASS